VDLVARVPGSVILRRSADAGADAAALTATGAGIVTGVRIESTAEAPIAVGLRITGDGRHVQWCELDGPMRAAVELTDARNATLESSTLHASRGTGVRIAGGSDIRLARNTLVREKGTREPALSLQDTVRLTLWRNVFGGYGKDLIRGVPAAERDLLLGNALSVVF
jgi:hypothetical protein